MSFGVMNMLFPFLYLATTESAGPSKELLLSNMQLEFLTLDFTSGSNNTITLSAVDHVGNELSSSPQLSVNVPQGINHFQRFENS